MDGTQSVTSPASPESVSSVPKYTESEAWTHHASALSEWAWRLKNRSEAWGEYIPPSRRNGDRKSFTGKGRLTPGHLVEHFTGTVIRGLHSTSPEDETCGWLALDVDQHGDHDAELAQANLEAVLARYDRLTAAGFDCLLTDSNGAGGFHLVVFLPERIPASLAHRFGTWLAGGLDCEVFPKQGRLTGKRYGNWLRLPGRHHTRDHWSKVWDGSTWLEGDLAIRHLLETNHGRGTAPRDLREFVAWSEQMDLAEQMEREQRAERLERFADGADAERVQSALEVIPPNVAYDEWLRVGMALHTWGNPSGLELWDAWSAAGSKYQAGECAEKWKSFTGGTVTLGTLFHLAGQHGWTPPAQPVDETVPVEIPPQPAGPVRDLADWRSEMKRTRLESLGRPGVYVDGSPTGAGKGHVERDVFRSTGHGVMSVPTHDNVRQEHQRLTAAGIDARLYPELTEHNCERFEQAEAVQSLGLPILSTVCKGCPVKEACQAGGYHHELNEARDADVRIMTHQRAALTGLETVSAGSEYVSIHENPLPVLRPRWTARDASLRKLRAALVQMGDNPAFLNSRSEFIDEQIEFVDRMLDVTERLLAEAELDHQTPVSIALPPETMEIPDGGYWQLHRYLRGEYRVADGTLALVVGIVAGTIHELTACRSSVIGIRHNRPHPGTVTWFCDATLDRDRLAELVGTEVHDGTPSGRLAMVHDPVQIMTDVKRGTSPKTVQRLVRGWLAQHPEFRRVGIICHKPHVQVIEELEPVFRRRVALAEYWRSGADVGSNQWLGTCDVILVMGTPRLPPQAIQEHLVTVGELEAAGCEGEWGPRHWQGMTADGRPVVVPGRGYHHPAWKRAHAELVRSRIVQAIGRGRGILENGLPVFVFSTEETGCLVDDREPAKLSETAGKLLELLSEGPKKVPELTELLGLKDRIVRQTLAELVELGAIQRTGNARATRYQTTELEPAENPAPNSKKTLLENGAGYSGPSEPEPPPDEKPTFEDAPEWTQTESDGVFVVHPDLASQADSEAMETSTTAEGPPPDPYGMWEGMRRWLKEVHGVSA